MTTPPSPKRLATLYGGEETNITDYKGQTHKVKIGIVPIRHLGDFIDLYDNLPRLLEFVCHDDGKPVDEGWSDQFPDEWTYSLFEKAKALNFHRAILWTEQQSIASKDLAPIVMKVMGLLKSAQTIAASQVNPATRS